MKQTNYENIINKVITYLKDFTHANELVGLWNTYCENNYMTDDRIEYMDDLNELFYDVKVSDFLTYINPHNHFDYADNYFSFDGYGHLYSFNSLEILEHIDINDLAEEIVKNTDDFYIDGELADEISTFFESEEM